MKRGDSLIYSPFIASEKQELRGIPDLLVRSDFIQSYFGENKREPVANKIIVDEIVKFGGRDVRIFFCFNVSYPLR